MRLHYIIMEPNLTYDMINIYKCIKINKNVEVTSAPEARLPCVTKRHSLNMFTFLFLGEPLHRGGEINVFD